MSIDSDDRLTPSESDRAEQGEARRARRDEIMAGNPDADVPVTRTDDVLRRFGVFSAHSTCEFDMAAAIAAYDNRVRDLDADAKRWRAVHDQMLTVVLEETRPGLLYRQHVKFRNGVTRKMIPGSSNREPDADALTEYVDSLVERHDDPYPAPTPAESRALARAADDDVAADDQRRESAL